MDEIKSLKFSFVEDNIRQMIGKLANNQEFIRYIFNLNDFPLALEYYDVDGNTIPQPDYPMPYPLIESKTVLLTLFNPTIVVKEHVSVFFSPLKGTSSEGDPLMNNKWILDMVIPYSAMIINGEDMRMFKLANLVCQEWDMKRDIAGVGRVIMYDWNTAYVSDLYQGIRLYFKVDDSSFTDEIDE